MAETGLLAIKDSESRVKVEALDLLLNPGCAKLAKKVKHSCEPPSHGSDCEDDSKAAETGGGRHVFEVAKIRFGNEAGGPSECGPDFFMRCCEDWSYAPCLIGGYCGVPTLSAERLQ